MNEPTNERAGDGGRQGTNERAGGPASERGREGMNE